MCAPRGKPSAQLPSRRRIPPQGTARRTSVRTAANPTLNWVIVAVPGVMFAIALSGKAKAITTATDDVESPPGAAVVVVVVDAHPCR